VSNGYVSSIALPGECSQRIDLFPGLELVLALAFGGFNGLSCEIHAGYRNVVELWLGPGELFTGQGACFGPDNVAFWIAGRCRLRVVWIKRESLGRLVAGPDNGSHARCSSSICRSY
jgi:hypothetical protein